MAVTLEKIVALCKRRGFVYQSAEIYGGLNGVYDFGPLGTVIKQNIRSAWLKSLTIGKGEILQLEGSILGAQQVWQASGHLSNFHDPMIDCLNCKKRYRTDDIDISKPCPSCGICKWTDSRSFNLMFKTQLGALESICHKAQIHRAVIYDEHDSRGMGNLIMEMWGYPILTGNVPTDKTHSFAMESAVPR